MKLCAQIQPCFWDTRWHGAWLLGFFQAVECKCPPLLRQMLRTPFRQSGHSTGFRPKLINSMLISPLARSFLPPPPPPPLPVPLVLLITSQQKLTVSDFSSSIHNICSIQTYTILVCEFFNEITNSNGDTHVTFSYKALLFYRPLKIPRCTFCREELLPMLYHCPTC